MAVTVILISKTVDCDQSHLTVGIILLEVLQLKVTDTGLCGTLITQGRNGKNVATGNFWEAWEQKYFRSKSTCMMC